MIDLQKAVVEKDLLEKRAIIYCKNPFSAQRFIVEGRPFSCIGTQLELHDATMFFFDKGAVWGTPGIILPCVIIPAVFIIEIVEDKGKRRGPQEDIDADMTYFPESTP